MTTVGLEVGATWLRGVVLGTSGVLEESRLLETPEDPEDIAQALLSLWRELGEVPTFGVAAAPRIDPEGRVIRWPSRPGTEGRVVLPSELVRALGSPVFDDVSAGALAEHLAATENDLLPSSTVLVALGTGVGAGFVLNDDVWTGADGNAMDFGHVPVGAAAGVRCPCGQVGCLQAAASGRLLQERAAQAGTTAQRALQAAEEDDGAAVELLEPFVLPLAQGLHILATLLSPHRIVLGGRLFQSRHLLDRVRERAVELGVRSPLLATRLGTWAGAVGAAVQSLRAQGGRLTSVRLQGPPPDCRIALVEGPNLNLLGEREPEHYGDEPAARILRRLRGVAEGLSCHLGAVQSNHEGTLVDWIQERRGRLDGAIVNPAALTASGFALRDALTGCRIPFIEVHLSNIDAREAWHQESCFAEVSVGRISGLRADGYEAALRALVKHLRRCRS